MAHVPDNLPQNTLPLDHARNQGFQHGYAQTLRDRHVRRSTPDPEHQQRSINEALAIAKARQHHVTEAQARQAYRTAFFRQIRQAA